MKPENLNKDNFLQENEIRTCKESSDCGAQNGRAHGGSSITSATFINRK